MKLDLTPTKKKTAAVNPPPEAGGGGVGVGSNTAAGVKRERSSGSGGDHGDNDAGVVDGADGWFPYDRIYPEQRTCIDRVREAVREKGHALIEAPPGTNQSLCVLSSLLGELEAAGAGAAAVEQDRDQADAGTERTPRRRRRRRKRKIIYATNSVPETLRVLRELAVVLDHRQKQHNRKKKVSATGENGNDGTKRQKLQQQQQQRRRRKAPGGTNPRVCEHVRDGFWTSTAAPSSTEEGVSHRVREYNRSYASGGADADADALPFLAVCLKGSDRKRVDAACRRRRTRRRGETNDGTNNNDATTVPRIDGLYPSLRDLLDRHGTGVTDDPTTTTGPGELTHHAIATADVLIVTYPYLLDPMTARMIGTTLYDNDSEQEGAASAAASEEKKKKEDGNDKDDPGSAPPPIVVFDHAHNIDAASTDALSATVTLHDLEQATRSLDKLSAELARCKQQQQQRCQHRSSSSPSAATTTTTMDTNSNSNSNKDLPPPLRDEYDDLVRFPIDDGMYRPVLFPSDDVVTEPVPGNIRHTKHFIGCMKKIIEHFKARIKLAASASSGGEPVRGGGGNNNKKRGSGGNANNNADAKKKATAGSVSPLAFLHQMMNATALDSKTLRFVHSRVRSMLRTLVGSGGGGASGFAGLLNVAYLASLLGFTNTLSSSKFAIVLEHTSVAIGRHNDNHHDNSNNNEHGGGSSSSSNNEAVMMLQVACLDPSLALKPIFDRCDTVILTSSTLSPLGYYPKILQFEPVVSESIPMTTIRPCVNPIMISRGSDQLGISTSYKERFTMGCIRNYGKMLVDLVSTIPDGVVVYFPSYNYMEALICEWDATGIMREMTEWKLVFVETRGDLELNAIALDNYRASCDIGRGGIFFSVARGSISESVPFDLHYGRALVMIGIPYEYTLSRVVKARLEFLQATFDIREQDYLTFDALRQVAKCFGRVVRSKTDYGVLVFADNRFHRSDKRAKLPGWVTQFLGESQLDLTTDSAVAQIKSFLRQTGQPVDQTVLRDALVRN